MYGVEPRRRGDQTTECSRRQIGDLVINRKEDARKDKGKNINHTGEGSLKQAPYMAQPSHIVIVPSGHQKAAEIAPRDYGLPGVANTN